MSPLGYLGRGNFAAGLALVASYPVMHFAMRSVPGADFVLALIVSALGALTAARRAGGHEARVGLGLTCAVGVALAVAGQFGWAVALAVYWCLLQVALWRGYPREEKDTLPGFLLFALQMAGACGGIAYSVQYLSNFREAAGVGVSWAILGLNIAVLFTRGCSGCVFLALTLLLSTVGLNYVFRSCGDPWTTVASGLAFLLSLVAAWAGTRKR